MALCRTGRHYWTRPEDAARCCDPEWRRVVVVGARGLERQWQHIERRPRGEGAERARIWASKSRGPVDVGAGVCPRCQAFGPHSCRPPSPANEGGPR